MILRPFLSLLLFITMVLGPSLAIAQQVHVAIVGVRGKGGGATAVQGLQAAVSKLRNITFESTRNFLAEAEQRGVGDRVESDPKAIAQVARALEVDAVVSGTLEEAKRSKGKVLTLSVYNGGDGKLLGEEVVEVPGGKLNPKLFGQAARAIEPYLRMGEHKAVAVVEEPVRPAQPAERAAPVELVDAVEPDEEEGDEGDAKAWDFLRVSGGLAFRSRSFEYKTAVLTDEQAADANTEYILPDGITYDSTLAPGVGLALELYPLALAMKGPVTGIGLTFGFEQHFLTSKQTITKDEGDAAAEPAAEAESGKPKDLDTTSRLLDVGLRYRFVFGTPGSAPEAHATFGMAWSTFELQKNDEYRGSNYRYPHIGLGGRIPFGTPLAAIELDLRFIPTADLGDTTQELGKSADITGYGVTADFVSLFGPGLVATAGVDYTGFSGDVKGEGRATEFVDAAGVPTGQRKVRIGKSVKDTYVGLHARIGYHF